MRSSWVRGVLLALAVSTAFFEPPPPLPDSGPFKFEKVAVATGSTLGVARLGPEPSAEHPALVFLHGGPGSPPQKNSLALLEAVADAGVPIVLYHQAGVGTSERLSPGAYTLARAVADLEALRAKLLLSKISLVGGSYGARLAYEYAARHPEHVAKVIFTSPGPLEPRSWGFDLESERAEKPPPNRLWVASMSVAGSPLLALAPREVLDDTMAQKAVRAAPMLFCPGQAPAEPPPLVGGFDGAQFLNLRADLARQPVPEVPKPAPPALVVRPECDVMSWDAAKAYRDRFGGTLVLVPGMGHVPDAANVPLLVKLWTAFLDGAELPLPAWTGEDDPAKGP